MEKFIKVYSEDFPLHSQSKQGIVQQYYQNLNSYFKSLDNHENPKPPYKRKKYNKVIFKKSAIKYKDNILKISNGRKGQAITINVSNLTKKPKYAELIYNHYQKRYNLHIVVEIKNKKINYENNKVLAIDMGQIHPMTTYDGKQAVIFNGGKLNSFIRFRNKELSRLQNKMSGCLKGSSRWKKLNCAKQKLLAKSRNKIMDVLKKYTSYLIDYCIRHKISTIVAGDIIDIRDNIKPELFIT